MKKVIAAVLDFLTVFLIGGFVIASLTGGTTEGGFPLEGGPALILFAVVIACFVVLSQSRSIDAAVRERSRETDDLSRAGGARPVPRRSRASRPGKSGRGFG